MPGGPYAALLTVHAVILCALAATALRVPRRSRIAIALAGLFYNAVPISPLFGMATPIFMHDLCVPFLCAAALQRRQVIDMPLFALCSCAALLWPSLGTAVGLMGTADLGESAQFIYRRLGFLVFFGAGLSGVLDHAQLRRFMDAGLMVWVGMAAAGLLQYAGVIDTDLGSSIDPELRSQTIVESLAAARGFMGLNRGAVGVWGSAAAAYAFVMLSILDRPTIRQLGAYGVAAAVSIAVLILSGSRTGFIAAACGLVYTAVRLTGRPARAVKVVAIGVVLGIGAGVTATGLGLSARFALAVGAAETGQQRLDIQRATLAYVLGDLRAATIGMGHSVAEFFRFVGQSYDLSHSHSEYIEILWQAGVPGLALYAVFIYSLFRRLRPSQYLPSAVVFAGRTILVSGLVAGVAVGNIFITSARLAPFSLLMAFVYGAMVKESRPSTLPDATAAEWSLPW